VATRRFFAPKVEITLPQDYKSFRGSPAAYGIFEGRPVLIAHVQLSQKSSAHYMFDIFNSSKPIVLLGKIVEDWNPTAAHGSLEFFEYKNKTHALNTYNGKIYDLTTGQELGFGHSQFKAPRDPRSSGQNMYNNGTLFVPSGEKIKIVTGWRIQGNSDDRSFLGASDIADSDKNPSRFNMELRMYRRD